MGQPTADSAAAAADKHKEPVEITEEDEEAIRAKLRQAGWDKKNLQEKKKKKENAEAVADGTIDSASKSKDAKRSSREDRDERDRDRRSGRSSRRDRDHDSRSSRRRRSRSRSLSDDRDSRRDRDRGRARSRGDKRRSRSPSDSRSRSRSPSKSRHSKRSRRDSEAEETVKKHASEKKIDREEAPKDDKKHTHEGHIDHDSVPADDKKKREGKEASDDRKSHHKSSRHRSRTPSRSPSRGSRHRRRRRSPSRSRSPSHSRRRGRSRSRSSRRRSSRRRSRSASRSRSYSRRRRSKSRESRRPSRRDANSSPEPHQHPPDATVMAVTNSLNPSITQLMQQYPTMSLQDIIAKMQATNVTVAAAASMKPARELYVGNLPASITGPQLQEFLGTIIQQVGLSVQPGNPILSTWISTDGHFAFCEMRSIEECNMALMLNQLPLLGQPLKFGRPKSFMGPPQAIPVLPPRTQTALANLGCTPNPVWFASTGVADMVAVPGLVASSSSMGVPFMPMPGGLPASANALLMSNIPVVLTEEQVKELVQPFGELKSFEFVTDPMTGQPTGSALFEYVDASVTEEAMKGLDGLDLGGPPLLVRRAAAGADSETGPVLRMANMVAVEELNDDEEFADLKEDVEEECKRFGNVVTLEIPRPKDGQDVAGVGDIFVQFETTEQAAAALKALSGRKFGGKIVQVSYFSLAKLQQKNFA